ncbi:MAG: S-layer homology domain-containing protein [Thermodesulfobacteriota bacterium]
MFYKHRFVFLSLVLIFLLAACGPKAEAPQAQLDTPQHHVKNGHKLLENGKLDAAFYEFNRAKELDPEYAPAYIGLGLVEAYRGDFTNGLKTMKTARKYARDDEQNRSVNVGYMRIYILGGEKIGKDWLERVEEEFRDAKRNGPEHPEAYYYMGVAYKLSYEFAKASDQFKKVLQLNTGFVAEADREYALTQKIERAMPGSMYGKKIAILEQITRADAAALFIEELKIDELYAKRTQKKFDPSFKSPEKTFVSGQYVKVAPATDIDNHVLKADINAVIEIGIKGLQPFPDHTYRPEQMVTRAEFAMMVEDILIKITGAQGLATQFIGSNSPFPDLRSDLPYFNAVMTCTTRGIMTAKDIRTGEFDPLGLISGADALLSIRALKSQL